METLIDYAEKYHDLGFNITYIDPVKNDPATKKIFKAPTNDRQILKNNPQTKSELYLLDWGNASGVGTVLGYNKLRALDLDLKSELKLNGTYRFYDLSNLMSETLKILRLPMNYEWVVRTPSNGYHIIFYSENHKFKTEFNPVSIFNEKKTKAFKPNQNTSLNYKSFGHYELRWNLHLVLPPSINENNIRYHFEFADQFPLKPPLSINLNDLYKLIQIKCLDYDLKTKRKGYNLFLNDYHKSHNYIDYNEILIH